MTTNKKYYKNVKRLFPIHLKKERLYLQQLKEQIDEYENCSYDELVETFGEPIDIVKSYYDTINSRYLLLRMNIKRIITITCISALAISVLYFGYRTYSLHEAVQNFQNGIPTEIKEEIEVIE